MLWSARALVQLNFLLAASQRYREVSTSTLLAGDAAVQQQAKEDAARELAGLLPRIPMHTSGPTCTGLKTT